MAVNLRSLILLESLCGLKSTILMENTLLFEGKVDDIYDKFYAVIPRDEFNKIVEADPTTKSGPGGIDKMGNYSKWLLNLYNNKALKLEDLYKATQYLTVFAKNSNKMPVEVRDIQKVKSLPDLYRLVQPYEGQKTQGEEKREIKAGGVEKLYEDTQWLVLWVKTEEAAKYYGKGTQWCTAGDNNNMFHEYHKDGNIYVNINKQTNEKYQFHFESHQFMDAQDDDIEPEEILTPAVIAFYAHLRNKHGRTIDFVLDGTYDFEATITPEGTLGLIKAPAIYHAFAYCMNSTDSFVKEFFTALPFNLANDGYGTLSGETVKEFIVRAKERKFPLTCFSDNILTEFGEGVDALYEKLNAMADDNTRDNLTNHFYMRMVMPVMARAIKSSGVNLSVMSDSIRKFIYTWAGFDLNGSGDAAFHKLTSAEKWTPILPELLNYSPFPNGAHYIEDVKLKQIFTPVDTIQLGEYIKKELSHR